MLGLVCMVRLVVGLGERDNDFGGFENEDATSDEIATLGLGVAILEEGGAVEFFLERSGHEPIESFEDFPHASHETNASPLRAAIESHHLGNRDGDDERVRIEGDFVVGELPGGRLNDDGEAATG